MTLTRRRLLAVGGLLVAALIVAGLAMLSASRNGQATTPPPPTTDESASRVEAAPPERLVIPAVGMDVGVEVDDTAPGGEVDPPSTELAYWLSSYGAPGTDADNTVYLAGHSSGDGTAIFDLLLAEDLSPLDLGGEPVRLYTASGELTYRIVGPPQTYTKAELPRVRAVWEISPGRLVMVTCDRHDPDRNIVFTADLESAEAVADG